MKFLEYFQNNYLLEYNINKWNYYDSIKHITNNTSESFNNYLNTIFSKKKKKKKTNFFNFINTKRISILW